MADFGAFARVMSSIGFAVFGLVLMTTIRGSRLKLGVHLLMILAFTTSGIILFSSTILKLPGWPAAMVAAFMWSLSLVTFKYSKLRRAGDGVSG